MKRIVINSENAKKYFYLESLSEKSNLKSFSCILKEYTEYLFNESIRSMNDHVAKTWLLYDMQTGEISAYMSLIMDAIKLSISEKELHNLKYPFRTIPAMKIAKLAVNSASSVKYKGLGTFMIESAETIALECNINYCAARFLTVDADIEHDKGVLAFYEKNGFIKNDELYNKNRLTISMKKDIYQ